MKEKNLDFIPECYVDTNLVETLLSLHKHFTKGVNHQMGCNGVDNAIKGKFEYSFAVGIIDADKRQPRYLDEFDRIAGSEHLALYKHNSKHHYIMRVSPAMDGFILACAEEVKVDMCEYGLSSDLETFTGETKDVDPRKIHDSKDYSKPFMAQKR